jgi:hypothetical protein
LFVKSAIVLEREAQKNRLIETAIAAQGTKESIEETLSSLTIN